MEFIEKNSPMQFNLMIIHPVFHEMKIRVNQKLEIFGNYKAGPHFVFISWISELGRDISM